jgi:hypothetical protein
MRQETNHMRGRGQRIDGSHAAANSTTAYVNRADDSVHHVRQWAVQTILFGLTLSKPRSGSTPAATMCEAQKLETDFFSASPLEAGDAASASDVIVSLATKVLEWIAQTRCVASPLKPANGPAAQQNAFRALGWPIRHWLGRETPRGPARRPGWHPATKGRWKQNGRPINTETGRPTCIEVLRCLLRFKVAHNRLRASLKPARTGEAENHAVFNPFRVAYTFSAAAAVSTLPISDY